MHPSKKIRSCGARLSMRNGSNRFWNSLDGSAFSKSSWSEHVKAAEVCEKILPTTTVRASSTRDNGYDVAQHPADEGIDNLQAGYVD